MVQFFGLTVYMQPNARGSVKLA